MTTKRVAILMTLIILAGSVWWMFKAPSPILSIPVRGRAFILQFHPSLPLLAIGSQDNKQPDHLTVIEFNTNKRTIRTVFQESALQCSWSPDGRRFIFARESEEGYLHNILTYRTTDWSRLWKTPFPDAFPHSLVELQDNEVIAVGGVVGETGWYKMRGAHLVSTRHAPLEFGRDSEFVLEATAISTDQSNRIAISYTTSSPEIPVEIGMIEFSVQGPHYTKRIDTVLTGPHNVRFLPDGRTLVGASNTQVVLVDSQSGQAIRAVPANRLLSGEPTPLSQTLDVSLDGQLVAIVELGQVVVRRLPALKECARFRGYYSAARISSDNRKVALSRMNRVDLFELPSLTQ